MTREMGISRSGDSDILIAEFAPRLETPDFREDIRPFIAFCNTVKIESPMKVISSLTPTELDLMNYLGSKFPYPAGDEELIQSLWGDKDTEIIDRDESLNVNVSRLREKIGRFQDGAIALYRIYGFKQYLLSPKLEVGKWIVPQDRAEKLQEFKEEVRPLMEFCSQVKVSGSWRLVPRLTLTQFSILSLIGKMFPSFVERDVLINQIWRDAPARINFVSAFNIQMSRLRGKISAFQNGAFTIPDNRRGPGIAGRYGLVRRGDIEYSG